MKNEYSLIKPDRLVNLTFRSYDEFIEEENCKPLEAASMVISNVAKAMIASNFNKVLVLKSLLELAKLEGDIKFEERINTLINNTTRKLESGEENELKSYVNDALNERIKENEKKFGS